jgi:hypothetical protein
VIRPTVVVEAESMYRATRHPGSKLKPADVDVKRVSFCIFNRMINVADTSQEPEASYVSKAKDEMQVLDLPSPFFKVACRVLIASASKSINLSHFKKKS